MIIRLKPERLPLHSADPYRSLREAVVQHQTEHLIVEVLRAAMPGVSWSRGGQQGRRAHRILGGGHR